LRTKVLASAVAYIAEHGPDGLSFRRIAHDAGVTHQAPYHHFTDRRGIFAAIAGEGFEMLARAMRDALDAPDGDPASALLESYVVFALDHRGHFRVMFRPDLSGLAEDLELAQVADASFGILLDFVAAALGPNASVSDVGARATAMWSLAHGLATLMIDGPLERKVGPVIDGRAFIHAVALQSGMAGIPVSGAHTPTKEQR
ncbi:MAG: TetR/AcrR family transcriptional regulator, partial [Acidimicrobiia bacterium]